MDRSINNGYGDISSYINAFKLWIKDTGAEIIKTETKVKSKKYGFAGRLDAVVRIDGRNILTDYKSGKKLHALSIALQLSAYHQALKETYPDLKIDAIAGLLLTDKGTYEYKEFEDCLPQFLLLLKFWEWKHKKKYKKLNYTLPYKFKITRSEVK